MGQSLELPRGYKVLNGSPVEAKSYNIANSPYTSVSQVLTELIAGLRYKGLVVHVLNSNYVFKDGILDTDLVLESVDFETQVDNKPTTLEGYGITNVQSTEAVPTIDNQIVVKNSNGDKRFETFMTADFEFTLDTSNILRSNISSYPQIITKAVGGTQVFTLDFEPTEILLVHGNVVLMPTDYLFTAPDRFEVFPLMADGEKIRILFNHFNI
jgi:hypothetical protein